MDNKNWAIAYAYNRKTGERLVFDQIGNYMYARFENISLKDFDRLKWSAWETNK